MAKTETEQDIMNLAPQKLLGSFAKKRLGLCWLLAIALHVVIIGGTSLDYIYFEWVNPVAGEARKKAVEEERKKAKEAALRASAAASVAATAASTNAPAAKAQPPKTEGGTNGTASADGAMKGIPEKYRGAKVVKEITETAPAPKVGDAKVSVDDL
jgi:hypothetical protein